MNWITRVKEFWFEISVVPKVSFPRLLMKRWVSPPLCHYPQNPMFTIGFRFETVTQTNTHNCHFVHSYILFSLFLLIFLSLSAPFFHDHPHPNTHTHTHTHICTHTCTHMHTRPQHDSVWLGPPRWSLTTLQQTAVVRMLASPYQGVWKLPELSGGDPVPDLSEWLPAGRKPGVLIGGESNGKRRTDT